MDFPKSIPNIGLVGGQFVDENTGTGQPGSLIPAAWGNSVTLEILNVLEAGGVVPDEMEVNQLAKAIRKIVTDGVNWESLDNKPTTLDGFGITDGMHVGAGGLMTMLPAVVGKVLDLTANQFITIGAETTDKPAAISYGVGLHMKYPDQKYGFDIVSGVTTEWYGVRKISADGSGAWRKIWTSADFDAADKADKATTLGGYGITNAYTDVQIDALFSIVDTAISGKANSATTLGGYGIVLPTQLQAEAGTDNVLPMTPLRVFQAIAKVVTQATESVMGIAKVASQAMVNAGTDNAAYITALKLKSGFLISLGTNGYIFFPAWLGGLGLQWGSASITSGVPLTQALPMAFPSNTLWCCAGGSDNSTNQAYACNSTPINSSSIRLAQAYGSPIAARYWAIGN